MVSPAPSSSLSASLLPTWSQREAPVGRSLDRARMPRVPLFLKVRTQVSPLPSTILRWAGGTPKGENQPKAGQGAGGA